MSMYNNEPYWELHARKVLCLEPWEPLPKRLYDILSRVDAVANQMGGALYSKQVVALAIVLCEEEQRRADDGR